MGSPLVGRLVEVGRARELLARGSGLIVEGEAGVGKTRLLRAIADDATAQGWQVERITGSAAAASVPFGAVAGLLPTRPVADRLRLLHHAQHELATRAARGPLLLVVDDAGLLDDGSAALVHRAAAVEDVVLVASERLGDPSCASLVALWRDGVVERLALAPLVEADARTLVEVLLGGPVIDELQQELWRVGRGNPLFVRELLAEGLERGSITRDGTARWCQLAPLGLLRLDDLVGARLQGLAGPARALLALAAVGGPVEIELVERLDPHGALPALVRSRLLTAWTDGQRTLVEPAHPLYGEVLAAELGPHRRREVEASLADGLVSTGLRRRGDALRAARWSLAAGHALDPVVLLRGAAEALGVFAFVLAERLARAGLAVPEVDRTEALHLLGRSLLHQGRGEDAERALAQAAAASGPGPASAPVALARAQNLFYSGRDPRRAIRLLEEGIASADGDVALELTAELALYESATADLPRAASLCRQVVAAGGTELVRLRAIIVLTLLAGMDGRFDEARRWIDEGEGLADRHQDLLPLARYQLALNRALLLWGSGRPAAGTAVLERALGWAVEEDGPWGGVATCIGIELAEQGDLRGAARALEEATIDLERFDPFGNRQMAWCLRAWVLVQQGQARAARAALATLPGAPSELGFPASLYAAWPDTWLTAGTGDVGGAGERARASGAQALGAEHRLFGAVTLHQAVRLGAASAVADLLAGCAATIAEGLVPAMADHAAALVDLDADRVDSAAGTLCALGSRLVAAEAYAQAAGLHADHGAPVAARRSAARSQALERGCPGASTPALAARPAALSARECDVALLALDDLSGREIAARLYVSGRTVDNHLGSTYRKLGLHGRDGLREVLGVVRSAGLPATGFRSRRPRPGGPRRPGDPRGGHAPPPAGRDVDGSAAGVRTGTRR